VEHKLAGTDNNKNLIFGVVWVQELGLDNPDALHQHRVRGELRQDQLLPLRCARRPCFGFSVLCSVTNATALAAVAAHSSSCACSSCSPQLAVLLLAVLLLAARLTKRPRTSRCMSARMSPCMSACMSSYACPRMLRRHGSAAVNARQCSALYNDARVVLSSTSSVYQMVVSTPCSM